MTISRASYNETVGMASRDDEINIVTVFQSYSGQPSELIFEVDIEDISPIHIDDIYFLSVSAETNGVAVSKAASILGM